MPSFKATLLLTAYAVAVVSSASDVVPQDTNRMARIVRRQPGLGSTLAGLPVVGEALGGSTAQSGSSSPLDLASLPLLGSLSGTLEKLPVVGNVLTSLESLGGGGLPLLSQRQLVQASAPGLLPALPGAELLDNLPLVGGLTNALKGLPILGSVLGAKGSSAVPAGGLGGVL
ncbi:hypothetical protein RQP46_009107 [Phenoliferia psychrophenolica]